MIEVKTNPENEREVSVAMDGQAIEIFKEVATLISSLLNDHDPIESAIFKKIILNEIEDHNNKKDA